ncbi:hypothetical protein Tco_1472835, partial [Tanacetum coccineum]
TKTSIVTAPTTILDPVLESDPEEPSKEDPLEDDSSSDDVIETAGLEVQVAPAPPAPYQIIHAPPALPRRPAVLRMCTPPALSSASEVAIAQWIMAPPPLSVGSSSRYSSSSPLGSSSSAPSSPYSEPSRRRSRSSSPSSGHHTQHRHHHLVRGVRSLTPPLPSAAAAVSTPPIERLPPRKRFRGTSSAPQEVVHVETTTEARLTHHGELIGEMYDHMLEVLLVQIL